MPSTEDTNAGAPPEAVTPLLRGVGVLRRLTDAGGRMAVGELERATGLARSTVDRVTGTLARMGYVRIEGRDVLLAPRLLELGNAYLASVRLPGLLGGRADALADALDESVSLAVPDGDGIRFVHQATRRRAMSVSFRIGDLLPAERTAPGALFASEWDADAWTAWRERRAADPQGRRFPAAPPGAAGAASTVGAVGAVDFEERAAEAGARGWAADDQLVEAGLVALAVPVRGDDGRIVCALSAVSHTSRHDAASLREALLPRLRTAAAAMERGLREAPAAGPSGPGRFFRIGPDQRAASGAVDRSAEEGGDAEHRRPTTARRGAAPDAASPAGSGSDGLAAWTGASKQELGRGFVESLARGLTVLTAFGEGRPALPLTAVAEATGLARATARRALITLEHLGLVAVDGRDFRLTPRVLSLGFAPLSRTTLTRIAQPHLADLAERVRESTSLAVLVGGEVQYTGRVETSRIMNVHITIGTRFPAYATSMGRVLLADLPAGERAARLDASAPHAFTPRTVTDRAELDSLLERVGHEGYALVDEELEEGLRSIAMPVRDRAGRAVAAVNVALHASRRSAEECVHEVLPELAATITAIEADLHVTERFTRVPAS
ncbi:IclR family transcriptional regulator domain-containing protein [Streptomyces roseicoloratus]|uniref:IclR family transcriptional regulator domain-containing protein n=1 Tax=Streptomyces roseicoloratus TaxID=2508722 RepID=UPI001009EF76|nr:IclR family transcriptional regulator C-terminal domain-containing protein [Streptomyces roseicoloratus]